MSIPTPAQAGPLTVSLDVVRLDVLVEGIVTAAFGELSSPRTARFGPRVKTERVERDAFAEHLRMRFMSAG